MHLAVLDALGIKGRHKCFVMYQNLVAEVSNLCPYYDFIACTRSLLGPVGTFYAYYPETRIDHQPPELRIAGVITIFPRFFGFSVDAAVYGLSERGRHLYPFHHGTKTNAEVVLAYGPLGSVNGSELCGECVRC